MRHVIAPGSIAPSARGMGEASWTAGLIAAPGVMKGAAAGYARAITGAINLAAIAKAADDHLAPAARAHKQPSRRRRGAMVRFARVKATRAKWTIATIAGIMPPHACPARCGARRRT